jgi:CHAD domain-containing protein
LKARIDVTGPVGPDIQSAMDELLSEAVGLLLSKKGDFDEAVHDARKNLKAFRSFLRLLRPIIGEDYVTLNVQARDAARTLSQARDSVALHDAISLVEKFYGHHKKHRPDFKGLRHAADAEGRDTASDKVIRAASKDVAALLSPSRKMVASWVLPENPAPYIKGLRTTYKAARGTLSRGLGTRLPYELHEARKRVIHWRYQLDLFTGVWPRVLKATVRELQDLREDLGQHNDLVLLETRIRAAERGFAELSDTDPFLDAITVIRARRVLSARYRQTLLFSDPPDTVASHLSLWWDAAKARKFKL